MPFCYDGVNDLFEASTWDAVKFSDDCFKRWSVRPDFNKAVHIYGGKDIQAASNIIFR